MIIDEVQNIPEFQKACDALYVKKNVDLYLTGSNAKLLSGDLATLLSGRYVQIKMLPLSFKEYISAVGEDNLLQKYSDFIENGSFPYTLSLSTKQENRAYIDGVFNSILIKDIASRGKVSDLNMLTDVIKFLFDSVGSPVSATNISNTMTSRGRKISVPTVENYIGFLFDAYILYKAERFDIKGKELLSGAAKYYIADTGLRFYLLGSKNVDMGHLLENIVYLELLRRGYKVNVGKFNDNEVDFVATNDCDTEYYQVAYTVADEKTLDRELKPLNAINDHNAKYLLTTDFTPYTTHNGIKQMNVFKWLLGENKNDDIKTTKVVSEFTLPFNFSKSVNISYCLVRIVDNADGNLLILCAQKLNSKGEIIINEIDLLKNYIIESISSQFKSAWEKINEWYNNSSLNEKLNYLAEQSDHSKTYVIINHLQKLINTQKEYFYWKKRIQKIDWVLLYPKELPPICSKDRYFLIDHLEPGNTEMHPENILELAHKLRISEQFLVFKDIELR